MDIKTLSIKAKEFGVWVHIFNRKLFLNIANSMNADENILLITNGHHLKTSYNFPVVISDKGVYVSKYRTVYGGLQNWAIPIDQITNTYHHKGFFFDTVIISIEGDAVIIGRQSKKKANKIMEILAGLRSRK